jgi:hypothetical protein
MDSKEVITVLKRYVNNKFTNTNLILKSIDSKLNNLISYMDQTKGVVDSNEKKIKTLNTYLYKAMKNLHTLIENSSGMAFNVPIVSEEDELCNLKDFEIKKFKPRKKVDKVIKKTMSNNDIRELRNENLEVEDSIVIKYLKSKDINSDINFFKYLYFDDVKCCPIRYLNKNNYQYWCDGAWCDDNGGENIANILVKNITKLYMKNNTYDNFGTNIDKYQSYIYSMSDKKYKDNFIKKIKELVKI